jgi:hypothetical protein
MTEHIKGCFITEIIPCPGNKSLHGEPVTDHWWNGWPGAFCLKCGSEDKVELCIGNICKCPCHDDFWRDYDMATLVGAIVDGCLMGLESGLPENQLSAYIKANYKGEVEDQVIEKAIKIAIERWAEREDFPLSERSAIRPDDML